MTKQQQANLLLVGFIGLLAIACVVALQLTKPSTDSGEADETPYAGEPAKNFAFIMPDAWKYFKNANKDIQALTPNQQLNFGVVESQNDSGMYYFATSAPVSDNNTQSLHGIYTYTSDYQFERIYKLTTDPAKNFSGLRTGANVVLHAIGHDDYKLIILAQDVDVSPGRCTDVYTLGRESDDIAREMLSLDLTNPYAKGLEPYRVPDDTYQAALARQQTCAESL